MSDAFGDSEKKLCMNKQYSSAVLNTCFTYYIINTCFTY